MAISDILSESAEEIRECLHHRPDAYADMKQRLERLLSEMDSIRIELDTPPAPDRGSRDLAKSPTD